MTIVTRIENFTLADVTGFKRLERDIAIDSGTIALLDFANEFGTSGADTIQSGDSIFNLVRGGEAAIAGGKFENVKSNLGLQLISTDNAQSVQLPAVFDLRNVESADIVLAIWFTADANYDTQSSYNAVVGHAYQSGAWFQWALFCPGIPSQLRFEIKGAAVTFEPATDEPQLVSAHITKTGAVTFYLNDTVIGGGNAVVPYNNPADGLAGAVPSIGILGGYGRTWKGTMHRILLQEISTARDVVEFLSTEIDINRTRFGV